MIDRVCLGYILVDMKALRFAKSVPNGHRWLVGLSVVLAITSVNAVALAAGPRGTTVEVEGYVGEAPAGVASEKIVLQFAGKKYDFAATNMESKSAHRSARLLMHDIKPHKNTLVLRGSESVIAPLTSASSGQMLQISGTHRSGTNSLTVTKIGPTSAASTTTKP